MAQTALAEQLAEAARADPVLLARMRSAYAGRHDLEDALWWRSHPLQPTPGGRPDPAAALEPLQAAVYSRAAPQEPEGEQVDPLTGDIVRATRSAMELNALEQRLAEDARHLDSVLDRFASEIRPRPAPTAARAGSSPTGTRGDPEVAPEPPPGGTIRGAPPRRRQRAVALVAAGAVAGVLATTGVLAPTGVHVLPGRSDPPGAASDRTPPATTSTPNPVGIGDATTFRLYQQPLEEGDPMPYLGEAYEQDSIRRLTRLDPAATGYGVYVARRGASLYCLVVQEDDGSGTSVCATPDVIVDEGLRLNAVVRQRYPVTDGAESASLFDLKVVWFPNGRFAVESAPHQGPVAEPADR